MGGIVTFLGIVLAGIGVVSFSKPDGWMGIKNRQSKISKVVLGLLLIIIGANISASSRPMESSTPSSVSRSPTPATEPKLVVNVQSSKYEYGLLSIVGTVKNVGDAPAISPTVKVQVRNEAGTVLLAEDTALIAGQFLGKMEPGVEAAFQSMTAIPGAPQQIRFNAVAQ